MNHQRSQNLKLVNIAVICILPLFAACEDEKKSDCNFIDFVTSACLNRVIENIVTGGGSGGGSDGSSGGGTSSDSGGSSTQGGLIIRPQTEIEPNNTLDNANALQFPPGPSDTHVGIRLSGSVHDTDDVADFFILTPNRSGIYRMFVRNVDCNCYANGDALYLMVYDQSQTTIASTPVGTEEPVLLNVELTSGLAYYVEVNGYDTLSGHYGYELIMEN